MIQFLESSGSLSGSSGSMKCNFHKKIYIPLSLVHLINMAGDNCMHQNACYWYYGFRI